MQGNYTFPHCSNWQNLQFILYSLDLLLKLRIQFKNIFSEFYRLKGAQDRHDQGGLGLGLAIVDRLCRLLGQPVQVQSVLGRGSCFAVSVPSVAAHAEVAAPSIVTPTAFDTARGKLVVVIDDDQPTLHGMGGLLRSWGCRVVMGASDNAALMTSMPVFPSCSR